MIELVHNRTNQDVLFAEANKEALVPNKGAYNYTDFNRVGIAVNTLANLLNGYGYTNEINLKTDWTRIDKIRVEDTDNYIEQIKNLISIYYTFKDTPKMPDNIRELFQNNGCQKANDIEKILLDIETLLERMAASFIYSNQYYSGEDHEDQAGFEFEDSAIELVTSDGKRFITSDNKRFILKGV